jgi:CBS domain-containing protein
MGFAKCVVDLMSRAPIVVGPQTLVAAAADHAARHGVHYLLVIDGYRLKGVVCSCDLQRMSPDRRVADCMHAPPVTVDDQATGEQCAELMQRCAVGCLPVVDWSGALAGVVTRHDLREAGLSRLAGPRCASCDSSHGLSSPGDVDAAAVMFCQRCLDQGCSATSDDGDAYFMLGGGD